MIDVNYVKRIKKCEWERKEDIPLEYVSSFLATLEGSLNVNSCEDPDYLNNLFNKIVRNLCNDWRIMPSKGQLNKAYLSGLRSGSIKKNVLFESMITVKATRSNSGELETTTTLPGTGMSCKYDCAMCPNQPGIARSYLSSEGSVVLGIIEGFDGFQQCLRRFIQYEYKMGHVIDKVLHILLGGTFHSYDEDVIETYITKLYYCGNMYRHFSIRNGGMHVNAVEAWLKDNPFMNHTSVMSGPLGEAIRQLRPMGTLAEEKAENTFSLCGRITGIVIETRPDQISYKTMYDLRRFGVTRVQLGVQHTDPSVLDIMDRKHYIEAAVRGIKMLRDNGFKVDGHLMPNCPGSTDEKDLGMLKRVFEGEDLQLDYCKLYICLDVPYTKIREWKLRGQEMLKEGKGTEVAFIDKWMKEGNFSELKKHAHSQGFTRPEDIYVWVDRAETHYEPFIDLLLEGIKLIPPWTRLNRFQRDFPEANDKNMGLGYVSTTLKSNLQQICMEELSNRGLKSYDIRSREVRKRIISNLQDKARVYLRSYRANEGWEFFLSVEIPNNETNPDDAIIMGLIRLRMTDWDYNTVWNPTLARKHPPSYFLNTFKKYPTLRVRELHVYGNLQTGNSADSNSQHRGIGKFLLTLADYVASYYQMQQIAIIAGVGVQDYYRKSGYEKNDESQGEYMVKQPDTSRPANLFGNEYTLHDFIPVLKVLEGKKATSFKNTQIVAQKSYSPLQNLVVVKYQKTTGSDFIQMWKVIFLIVCLLVLIKEFMLL